MRTILLALFLVSSTAFAQGEGLSLSEAKELAFGQNPSLKNAELGVQSAEAGKLKAWSAQLPHVGIEAQHMIKNQFQIMNVPIGGAIQSFPAITPYTIASLQGSLLLFDGFSSWDRISAAASSYDAENAELSRARLSLENEIRTKFFQALGAAALVDVAEQNISTLEQHWKDVSSRVRAGVATKFDQLRVEVLLEDARTAKLAAEDNRVIARRKLWQALGVADDGRALEGALPETWDNLPANFSPSAERRDDRKAAQLRSESAAKMARAEGKFWVPKISLFGDYDQYNNLTRTISGGGANFDQAYVVGITLSWNIFDGGLSWAEKQQAGVEEEKSALRLKEIDDSLDVDFDLWRRRYVYSVAAFKAKKVAIQKAEESIRIARSGARAGIRTNTEVLDAVRDLNEEKAKLVQAQVDAVEALGNLELASGHTVEGVTLHVPKGASSGS